MTPSVSSYTSWLSLSLKAINLFDVYYEYIFQQFIRLNIAAATVAELKYN